MKIVAAEIDGFGVWSGLKLPNLADRVSVFYGLNEAGKTTLLQFVRSMLYGFSHQRGRRYLPPVHGGRPGGSLVASAGGVGRYTISRHASLAGGESELRVLGPDGTVQGDFVMRGLLGGIDEATFNHVFAVGLREVQELGTLGDSAAADFLYHLSTGLSGVALADVFTELAAARSRLVSPPGGACLLGDLLDRRVTISAEIDELRGQVHRQAAIAHELAELAADAKQCEAEQSELDGAQRAIQAALAVRGPWRRRAELLRELAALAPLEAVPIGAVERLDQLNDALASRRRKIADIVRSRRSLRREAAELAFNARLARHAPRVEALAEQEAWMANLEKQVDQQTAKCESLEAELAEHRRLLGLGGKLPHKSAAGGSLAKRLRPAARALAGPHERLKAAQEDQAQATQEAESLAGQIAKSLSGAKQKELAPALEQAGNLVSQLRRRTQVDERLSQLASHENELAEQTRALLDRQLLPSWVLVALGGVFVLGVVLVLASMFLPSSLVGSAGWLLAAIGALGAAGAAGGKFLLDRSAASQLEACQKQSAILASQVKQTKEERETLDRDLPRGGGPLLMRLQTAEKDLASLEELLGVDARRQAATAAAEAARARVAAAETERRDARRKWEQALIAAGLPKQLTPKQARKFDTQHRRLSELERARDRHFEELQQRQDELDMLSGRLQQLLTDVGFKPVSQRPTEQLRELSALLDAHQVVAAERGALNERASRLKRQQARLAHAVRRGEQRRQQWLHEVGAVDEEELRERAAEHARRQELAERCHVLSRDIDAALAGRLSADELRAWLDADLDLEQHLHELAGQIAAAAVRLQALHETRGRLEQEAKALVADRRLAMRLADLEIVDEQARDATERWRVLSVAAHTLDAVRHSYEKERQPEALREASAFLERLTEGRYLRVWAPLGERALRVDDAAGNSLAVEVLSRGTREQLFLSLRLALIGIYARRGVELPLVLDDVLVNFDARRTRAAAKVLRDFADSGHQVLVFTCHEHLAAIFRQLKVPVYELPSNDDLEPVTVAYPQPVEAVFDEQPDELPDEPPAEPPDLAATWHPEPVADGLMEIAEDRVEEEVEPLARPRRRRKPKGRKKRLPDAPPPVPIHAPLVRAPIVERPHRVSIVRGRQLQNPFADTSWHELVDDDEDDPIIIADESSADELEDDELEEDESLFDSADVESWPDGPNDWQAGDDDEFEAA